MNLPIIAPANYRIIAHRGASGYAPENTMCAFRLAYEMGCREFELDLQISKDKKIVICHDASLGRLGYESVEIEKTAWQELSELDMGAWFSPFQYKGEKMILLNNLFEEFGDRVTYHIEFKQHHADLIRAFLDLMEECGLQQSIIVTSFSYDCLQEIRKLKDSLRLGWLVSEVTEDVLAKANEAHLFQVCPRISLLDAETVCLIHRTIPEVRAWGFTGKREETIALIQKSIQTQCDGVTINWPDWIKNE